jgi:N-acetylglucosaminyldiphosphoundecaprenol N-acetyl-beta-D-mannosaminyltransferase
MRTIPVLNSLLTVMQSDDLREWLTKGVRGSASLAVEFANVHVVTLRRRDPDFRALSVAFDVTVPDGKPLLWCMNARGASLGDRIYGPWFFRDFMAGCPGRYTHYLVGGSEGCQRRLQARLRAANPALSILGDFHGVADEAGLEEVAAFIRQHEPDFIWVALGTPKQQEWIAALKRDVPHGVFLSVGYAFDVNAGLKRDAPAWMHRAGLGWLHRLLSEPRRLWRRYLVYNSLFLVYLAADAVCGTWRRSPTRRSSQTDD